MRGVLFTVTILLLVPNLTLAELRVDKNVVYGMYSGLALLMDVHHPETPNGYAVVLIPGSGWQASQGFNAPALKDGGSAAFAYVPRLLGAGYKVFIVNHRAAPRFRYPAAVEDIQRAVRFVRFHATDYQVNADHIGAVGHSSGAHLATLVGVLDGAGVADDADPVNRLSARVQCVVAGAAPTDFERHQDSLGVASFMGQLIGVGPAQDPVALKAYRAASPVTYVSRSSSPLLLIHGDADRTVPFSQAELMLSAMQRANGEVKLIRVPSGEHRFPLDVSKHPEWPDVLGEMVRWLDGHLKRADTR